MKHLLKKAFVGILMLLLFNPAYAKDCMDISESDLKPLFNSKPTDFQKNCMSELFQKRAELDSKQMEALMWLAVTTAFWNTETTAKETAKEVVKTLLQEGFDPNIKMATFGISFYPVFSPTSKTKISTEQATDFITPLLWVAQTNQIELIDAIISAKTEMDFEVELAKALSGAALYDKAESVQALIDRGVNIERRNKNGRTPLMNAVYYEQTTKSIKALISAGADIDAQDFFGRTASIIAAKGNYATLGGYAKNMTELISAGADLNKHDIYGKTPLIYAAQNGNTKVLTALINAGVDLDKQDDIYGKTAVIYAAEYGHTDSLNLLIFAGANLDLQDNSGNTALMLAVKNNRIENIEPLFAGGANPDIKDADGYSSLEWIYVHGQDKMAYEFYYFFAQFKKRSNKN